MCQAKEEEDSPALKIALMHHYNDSKTTFLCNKSLFLLKQRKTYYSEKKQYKQHNDQQNNKKNLETEMVGWLVEFCGISTFVGYLTPYPFLCK